MAGLLFFNDVGDEIGGLTFTGLEANGQGTANAGLMFDQWEQDQRLGFSTTRVTRPAQRRAAGVGPLYTQRLSELIERLKSGE